MRSESASSGRATPGFENFGCGSEAGGRREEGATEQGFLPLLHSLLGVSVRGRMSRKRRRRERYGKEPLASSPSAADGNDGGGGPRSGGSSGSPTTTSAATSLQLVPGPPPSRTPRLNNDIDLLRSGNVRGILISCKFRREISATREAVRLFTSFAQQQDAPAPPSSSTPIFQPCQTGASGLVFLRILSPQGDGQDADNGKSLDPMDAVQRLYREYATMPEKLDVQFMQRAVPVQVMCDGRAHGAIRHATADLFRRQFHGASPPPPADVDTLYSGRRGRSVAVCVHTRGRTATERKALIDTFMSCINDRSKDDDADGPAATTADGAAAAAERPPPHHPVDLQNPELVVLAELLPIGVCCVSVVEHHGRDPSRPSILEYAKTGLRVRSLLHRKYTHNQRPPPSR